MGRVRPEVATRRRRRSLTAREIQIARLLSVGLKTWEVAEELGISCPTAKTHIQNMLQKTGSTDRAHLCARFARGEWCPPTRYVSFTVRTSGP